MNAAGEQWANMVFWEMLSETEHILIATEHRSIQRDNIPREGDQFCDIVLPKEDSCSRKTMSKYGLLGDAFSETEHIIIAMEH